MMRKALFLIHHSSFRIHHFLNDAALLRLRVAGADFFGGDFGLHEEAEVIAPAGFRVCAAHVEAAEGVRADERARALAVEVEVADVELAARALQLRAVYTNDREKLERARREFHVNPYSVSLAIRSASSKSFARM